MSGNSYTNLHDLQILLAQMMQQMMQPKLITWIRNRDDLLLSALHEVRWSSGLKESDIDPIQEWCNEANCGKRVSFNTFKFRNEEEITMFLMRWS